ncbi:MAG: hypothetical protein OXG11_05685, partial [Chloroflexi bacterium]|nr:hypothetical protein [Chloroflexota bacterium]
MISNVSRRRLLKIGAAGGLGAAALAIAGCGETQVVEVVKEVPVVQEKIVEKVVTQEVEVQKVVTKEVERIVTVEAAMPKKAAVHLNFNTWWGTVEEYSAEVGEPFIERNPHVTIDWQVTPWGEYWQKMQTQAVSNELRDFFG